LARCAEIVTQVAEDHRGEAVIGDEIARGRKTDMRIVWVTLALAIVTGAAFAQDTRDMGGAMKGGGKGRHAAQSSEQQKADQEKKKAAEDAYKAALKGIPDAKVKDDPWRGVR
jgi:hypothetical protein